MRQKFLEKMCRKSLEGTRKRSTFASAFDKESLLKRSRKSLEGTRKRSTFASAFDKESLLKRS